MTWNCRGGFRRKLDRLASLAPDVAVVCEAPVANPYVSALLAGSVSWHSAGANAEKGLAVAGFRGQFASVAPEPLGLCSWGVGVAGADGPGVLGVWSVPAPGRRYGDEVLAVIDAHAEWIAGGNVAVAGDFNIDAHGVGNGGRGAKLFADIVRRLAALGLVSAYHAWTGEDFGSESRMTHYHLRKPDRGFHIDFCFVPTAWSGVIRGVSIGAPEDWLPYSDHMPLLVDLAGAELALRKYADDDLLEDGLSGDLAFASLEKTPCSTFWRPTTPGGRANVRTVGRAEILEAPGTTYALGRSSSVLVGTGRRVGHIMCPDLAGALVAKCSAAMCDRRPDRHLMDLALLLAVRGDGIGLRAIPFT